MKKLLIIIPILLIAGLAGVYLSGSQFAEHYQAIVANKQINSKLSISSEKFETSMFSSNVISHLIFSPNESENINIAITSKVLHLPWGVSIDSSLVFSSDKFSEAMVKKEFGSTELLTAHSQISPIFGYKVALKSLNINDEKGDFAAIDLTLNPKFNTQQQLSGVDYTWTWDGAKLKPNSSEQQFSISGLTGNGQLSIDRQLMLVIGSNQIQAKNITLIQNSDKVIINNLAIDVKHELNDQQYLTKLSIAADNSDLNQMGFNFDLKKPSLDFSLNIVNAEALGSLNTINDKKLSNPDFEVAINKLLSSGGQFNLNNLSFHIDDGQTTANLLFDLQPGLSIDDLKAGNNDKLFSLLSATGEAIFDQKLINSSELSIMLLGMKQNGFLSVPKDDNKSYAPISFKNKVLTINNKVIPM